MPAVYLKLLGTEGIPTSDDRCYIEPQKVNQESSIEPNNQINNATKATQETDPTTIQELPERKSFQEKQKLFSSIPLSPKSKSMIPKKLDMQIKTEETTNTLPDNTVADPSNETETPTETAVAKEPISVNYAAVAGSLKKLHKIMRNEPPSPIPVEEKVGPVIEPIIEPAVPVIQEQRKKKKKCTIL